MIKENWVFWILLILFIGSFIDIFLKIGGIKRSYSWDAEPLERVFGVIATLIYMTIIAIALGWIF